MQFLRLLVVALLATSPAIQVSAGQQLPAPELSDSGLHAQPWFLDSFMDFSEDLAEAGAAGKKLVIFIEQRGCSACRRMHHVTLRDPDVVAYLTDHFLAVQLNLHGSRETTDFDGESLEERALARKWAAARTPTLLFFSPDRSGNGGQPGRELSVLTMPGYMDPAPFRAMLEFVADGHYEKDTTLKEFLDERVGAKGKAGEKAVTN